VYSLQLRGFLGAAHVPQQDHQTLSDLDGQGMYRSQYLASSSQGAFVEGTCFVVVILHMQEESEFVQGFSKGEMDGHKRLFTDREHTKKQRPCLCRLSLVSVEHCQRI
jgi:hypothetical protein